VTTGDFTLVGGGVIGATTYTNEQAVTLRTGPGETVILSSTNGTTAGMGVGVINSEWRN
jgi:hypothetical protein